mmetsp:Transcript_22746/g.46222  ORF Transcript_22746/g.46222 Transcript_22746/m.46222 type:complete len:440 (-) Transcript_22746:1588-2907(-)
MATKMNYGTMSLPASRPSLKSRLSTRTMQVPVLKTIITRQRKPTVSKTKSFVYTMMNPRSTEWQAVAFKYFISTVIILDLVGFIMSTDSDLNGAISTEVYVVWEAVDSWIFLTEYILRLIAVTESVKYGSMGPIKGRFKYAITTPALIDLVATLPYFLEQFSGYDLPTLTYLRSFRLLRILKTQGFIEAIKSVCRVFRYNSEILYVAVWIGMGLVLFTAVLMYYLRPRDEDNPQFKSLPATLYLATMMLTGQGGPDGSLPWYTSCVVVLTGVFSIGMFAIPASMLTWGFEGEAERLAKLRWKRASGNLSKETKQNEDDINDDWSYSSADYSTDQEYLNVIAGGIGDDDSDDEETKALKAFHLADIDHSGNLSIGEYLKLSRDMSLTTGKKKNENDRNGQQKISKRLQDLENKVEENSKKLDRICEILEGIKFSQQFNRG